PVSRLGGAKTIDESAKFLLGKPRRVHVSCVDGLELLAPENEERGAGEPAPPLGEPRELCVIVVMNRRILCQFLRRRLDPAFAGRAVDELACRQELEALLLALMTEHVRVAVLCRRDLAEVRHIQLAR